MMEIVIKISEEDYKRIQDIPDVFNSLTSRAYSAIKNGTPLPKGHGRLIDADFVKNTLDLFIIHEYNGQFIRRSDIDTIPTIIEADRGE